MRMMRSRVPCLAVVFAVAAATAAADAGDPPSRVARLSFQSGSVSFRPGSVEDWTPAALNYPLTTGDHLWTESGARAEMHVGSTGIRMASGTALAILNLDDNIVQLSLTEGSLEVTIRSLGEEESYEVDTPNAAISLLRPGRYRIDADDDNQVTVVTVRGGEAEISGAGSAFPVRASESARLTGVDSVAQEVGAAPGPDEFDGWCEARDRREEQSQSVRYVGQDMTGYEDLDQYGVWREDAQYGWIWAPRGLMVGWAPYRYGRWVWVEPWGWTWVDEEPWGFAPFHYGRWAYAGGGWVWVPGTMVRRPVYAPALVAFVGGPGFAISVSAGGPVGWFPLGPREVYRPAYHVSDVYVRQVNITHVNVTNINVTNVRYVNQDRPGAVTVVSHDTFVMARPVRQGVVAVPPGEIARARVIDGAPIAPRRESVLGGTVRAGAPPRYADRAVVARTPPPPPPVSFAAKQRALEANPGRPLDATTVNGLRDREPARNPMVRTVVPSPGGNVPGRPAITPNASQPGGWRQANPENRASPAPQQPGGYQQVPGRPRNEIQTGDRPGGVRQPVEPQPLPAPRVDRPARTVEPQAQPAPRAVEQPRNVRPADSGSSQRTVGNQPRTNQRDQRKVEKKTEKRDERKDKQ